MDEKEYDKPSLTVDAVIMHNNCILLIKRKNEPYKDYWALPGGYVNKGETCVDAIHRELLEETSLDSNKLVSNGLIGIFDGPDRDPRGWVVSVAFSFEMKLFEIPEKAMAGDDAAELKWFAINRLPNALAFDHASIITSTVLLLNSK